MPTDPEAARPFPYMDFARRQLMVWGGAQNLGLSGVAPPQGNPFDLPAWPPYPEAHAAYRQAVGDRFGVAPACVYPAAGTSHANFVVLLGLARGGRVAVERPAYEALPAVATAVGAEVTRFDRRPEDGWALDAASVREAAIGADLLVVSDLHNPTGRRVTEDEYTLLLDVAAQEDALLLVDEVYAPFDAPRRLPTAHRRSPRVLATNSLTKAWGFGDLRAGWILGSPEHLERVAAYDDLVNPMLPSVCLDAATRVLANDTTYLQETRDRAAARRDQVNAWVRATPGVSWVLPDAGITGFVRIDGGDEAHQGDVVAERAAARGVRTVPGSFFQRPAWLRLSFDLPAPALDEALDVVRACL